MKAQLLVMAIASFAIGSLLGQVSASQDTGGSNPGRGSWVFLQDDPDQSLVRLSADESSLTTIASSAAGAGLAMDLNGDYIVAARKALLRVTRSGKVNQIAAAPGGSSWTRVGVTARGEFIAADGVKPVLWRISPDGRSVEMVASYRELECDQPGSEIQLALAVDPSGEYLLLFEGAAHLARASETVVHFLRVRPDGSVARVPLTGIKLKWPAGMTPDGHDGYLVVDPTNPTGVLRLSLDGNVSLADPGVPGRLVGPWAVAASAQTGGVMTADGLDGLIAIGRSDSQPLEPFKVHLTRPTAVVWDGKR